MCASRAQGAGWGQRCALDSPNAKFSFRLPSKPRAQRHFEPQKTAEFMKRMSESNSRKNSSDGFHYKPPPKGTSVCIYIYICLTLVQMCFHRRSRQEEKLRFAHWETRGGRFASVKKDALDVTHALFQWLFHTKFNSHIFPHKPCLLSKALPQITHISSHTNHALFQSLFHRKFTHPLTQHMSFYVSSFNETNAAYVKELPRKVNPV